MEINNNENLSKNPVQFKWLPFSEGVRKGAIFGAFCYVIWLIVKFLANNFLEATAWIRELVIYFLNMESVASLFTFHGVVVTGLSVAVLLPVLWLIGHIPLQTMEDHFAKIWRRIFKKKKEKKILFCIKLKDKNFFGGYPIGFVTQILLIEGKIYYHTWWPGLMHLTLPFVAAEDVEILDMPVRAVLKIYMLGGAL